MLDIAVAYNKYGFLGNEFLTWLWYAIDTNHAVLHDTDEEPVSFHIGNRIVLERSLHDESVENIKIKGDDASLEEGILALKKGAVVTELNMVFEIGEHRWRFNVRGESFNLTGFKVPETGNVEKKEDIEGAVLEKIFLHSKAVDLIDGLFKRFINLRVSNEWKSAVVPQMRRWLASPPA